MGFEKSVLDKLYYLILMWLPYFIIHYPGILVFDSIDQISQVIGGELVPHHPLIHTLFIGGCYRIGVIVGGTSNAGAAVYTITQVIIMALINSNVIRVVNKYISRAGVTIAVWAYFALVPFNAMYSLTMWKDTLFAGFTLWMITVIYEIVHQRENANCVLWIQFVISSVLMILFRTNGKHAYILCVPFLVLWLSKSIRKNLMMVLVPLVVTAIITGPIYNHICTKEGRDIVESLSIPLQHVARVVSTCDNLDNEDIELIEKLAPIDSIRATYNCRFADPMKLLMWSHDSGSKIEENKMEYFWLWLKLGLQHPVQYILAELDMTVGYWYPGIQYRTMEVGVYPNDYGIYTVTDTSSSLYQSMYKYIEAYRMVPLLGNLFSMGTMFMLALLALFVNWYKHNNRNNLVILPILGVWFTLFLATPLFAEMRYAYSMMLSTPIVLIATLKMNKIGISKEHQEKCEGKEN